MDTVRLQKFFEDNNYEWSFRDGPRVPTVEELSSTLDKIVQELIDSEEATQIELGRLIVRKSGEIIDTYVHFGENNVSL